MSDPHHNKKHASRAASLKRIAKALRVRAKNSKAMPQTAEALKQVAEELDFEAKTLRAVR